MVVGDEGGELTRRLAEAAHLTTLYFGNRVFGLRVGEAHAVLSAAPLALVLSHVRGMKVVAQVRLALGRRLRRRRGIGKGAGLEQQLDERGVADCHSVVEGGRTRAVAKVGIGASLQDGAYNRWRGIFCLAVVARLEQAEQQRFAVAVAEVDVGAGREQHVEYFEVLLALPFEFMETQRVKRRQRSGIVCCEVWIRAGTQQRLHNVRPLYVDGEVERRVDLPGWFAASVGAAPRAAAAEVGVGAGVEEKGDDGEAIRVAVVVVAVAADRCHEERLQSAHAAEFIVVVLWWQAVGIWVEEGAELGGKALHVGKVGAAASLDKIVDGFDGSAGWQRASVAAAACGIVGERHRGRVAARGFAKSRRGEKSVQGSACCNRVGMAQLILEDDFYISREITYGARFSRRRKERRTCSKALFPAFWPGCTKFVSCSNLDEDSPDIHEF